MDYFYNGFNNNQNKFDSSVHKFHIFDNPKNKFRLPHHQLQTALRQPSILMHFIMLVVVVAFYIKLYVNTCLIMILI